MFGSLAGQDDVAVAEGSNNAAKMTNKSILRGLIDLLYFQEYKWAFKGDSFL
jgi:hypothetical protein